MRSLLDEIYNTLIGCDITEHVYYLHLPSEELLKQVTVTYEVNLTNVESTFDSREALRIYSLKVKVCAPSASELFDVSSIYSQMYSLSGVKHIALLNEENFYDPDLNVYCAVQFYVLHQ